MTGSEVRRYVGTRTRAGDCDVVPTLLLKRSARPGRPHGSAVHACVALPQTSARGSARRLPVQRRCRIDAEHHLDVGRPGFTASVSRIVLQQSRRSAGGIPLFMRHFSKLVVALAFMDSLASANPQQHAPVAHDVTIRRDDGSACVEFTITWPNAWRSDKNHDAAWIVLRTADPLRGPVRVAEEGHAATGDVPGTIEVSTDRVGVFLSASKAHRGPVKWRVSLVLDGPAPDSVTPWTVGMVYVPGGAFELGDDDPLAVRFGAFHSVGESRLPVGPVRVASEASLRVASEPGALWYTRDPAGYRGDQRGPIPEAWPKGTLPFYVMKHELTQGEYVAFLNALPSEWRSRRAPLDLTGEDIDTCSIVRDGERFVARAPDRPCNFVSWDDTCALFDWLALRPITEFEFEKAARGPRRPVAGDFPWGTASSDALERRVQRSRDLTRANIADESWLTDDARVRLGASYYWVMDLAGSVWERVISAGHPAGRGFRGTHGDGALSENGLATNEDWPRTSSDGRDAPGVGFRGGAEYFDNTRADDPTNPYSRTAVRTYAGWGGAQRYKTYSARAGRTAHPSS